MIRCYIGLGSNLGDPARQLRQAQTALTHLPRSSLVAVSPWYRSRAVGPGEQPDYLNAVAALDTELAAAELLEQLQAIEQAQGRIRTERWGARTLDLDILLYGDQIIATATLQVPHPRLRQRAFVLRPLADLAPDLTLPDGVALAQLVPAGDDPDLTRSDA